MLHIYPLCGIFYFLWYRHQIEGTFSFLSVSSERLCQSGAKEIAKVSKWRQCDSNRRPLNCE